MIAVVDYSAGNMHSVARALNYLGVQHEPTADANRIREASAVILPGVGSAGHAMQALSKAGLVETLQDLKRPFLGVCLGLQLLFESTAEGDKKCLGVFEGRVSKLFSPGLKVPHVGWNQVSRTINSDGRLLKGIDEESYFYFVHSFFAGVTPGLTLASSCYGPIEFSSVVHSKNYWGVQFHPELSGQCGLRLLQNFVRIAECWS